MIGLCLFVRHKTTGEMNTEGDFRVAGKRKMIHNMNHNESLYDSLEAG